MQYLNWDEEKLLTVGESIVYKCELEDNFTETNILILTNLRIIRVAKGEIFSKFLKTVEFINVYENEQTDVYDRTSGKGNYVLDIGGWSYRFYAEDIRDNFYEETLRTIAECFV